MAANTGSKQWPLRKLESHAIRTKGGRNPECDFKIHRASSRDLLLKFFKVEVLDLPRQFLLFPPINIGDKPLTVTATK